MRISLLDRLVLREVFLPLVVGLLAILQLLLVGQFLQLNSVLIGGSVSVSDFLRLTLGLLPHFLVTALPLAYVLGLQLGLGRLSGDRELLALAAAGRSPMALYRVPLLFALLLGAGTFALARWSEPWGLSELNHVLNGVIKRNLESGVLPGVFNDGLPRFMVYVDSQVQHPGEERPRWRGVLIEDRVGDGAPVLALAEEGTVIEGGGETLDLSLARGELHRSEAGGETVARFEDARFLVGVKDRLTRLNRLYTSESALTPAALEDLAVEMEAAGRHDLAQRARLEGDRRLAAPLACLAFMLLGVPLAVLGAGARGFAYLFTLGSFLAFYALSRAGVATASQGGSVLLAAFGPDLLIALIGAVLSVLVLRRGVRTP